MTDDNKIYTWFFDQAKSIEPIGRWRWIRMVVITITIPLTCIWIIILMVGLFVKNIAVRLFGTIWTWIEQLGSRIIETAFAAIAKFLTTVFWFAAVLFVLYILGQYHIIEFIINVFRHG